MMSSTATRTFPGNDRRYARRACLLAVLAAAGLAHAQPAAAQSAWKATTETEAERAYRSVYERSLTMGKRQPASAAVKPHAAKAKPADPKIPDLPERNERRAAQSAPVATTAAMPGAKPQEAPIKIEASAAEPAPKEKTGWKSPMDLMGNPVIPQPSLNEVITTQVIGDDRDQPADTRRAQQPGPAEQYCSNIASAATDARFAWQKQTLMQTEQEIKERVEELKGKIAEYQKWLDRRDEFSRKAQAAITDIYTKMKPDAAAQQLMALDEETAAAVVTKLNARVASAVMAEMEPKAAARLTAIIAGSAKGPKGKPPAKPQAPGGT